jgi:hypothetical protein
MLSIYKMKDKYYDCNLRRIFQKPFSLKIFSDQEKLAISLEIHPKRIIREMLLSLLLLQELLRSLIPDLIFYYPMRSYCQVNIDRTQTSLQF